MGGVHLLGSIQYHQLWYPAQDSTVVSMGGKRENCFTVILLLDEWIVSVSSDDNLPFGLTHCTEATFREDPQVCNWCRTQ